MSEENKYLSALIEFYEILDYFIKAHKENGIVDHNHCFADVELREHFKTCLIKRGIIDIKGKFKDMMESV